MPGVVVRGVRAHGQTTTRAAYALLLLVLSMPENWRRAPSVRGPFGSVSAEDAKSVTRAACGISVDWWGMNEQPPGPRRNEMKFGYFLSSEEHNPRELLDQAIAAEEAGFRSIFISDHF